MTGDSWQTRSIRPDQSLFRDGPTVPRAILQPALRRPERFLQALQACECDARGRLGFEDKPYPQRERLTQMLHAALSVDTATVSAQALAEGLTGPAVGTRIEQARLLAMQAI